MAGETVITIVGNLTSDPELRTTSTGRKLASFTIASTSRSYNRDAGRTEDGQTLFMNCTVWQDLADHVIASLSKGSRVIAQGRLSQRSYEAKDGSRRTIMELTVEEIGPSLRWATAKVERQSASTGFAGRSDQGSFDRAAGQSGGYRGGASYQGGAAYQGGASYQNAASQGGSDVWGASGGSDGYSSFGGSDEFGADEEIAF